MTIRLVQEDSFNISSWFIRIKHVYRNYLYSTKLKNFHASLYIYTNSVRSTKRIYSFVLCMSVRATTTKNPYFFTIQLY
jgi:hypothetical protein